MSTLRDNLLRTAQLYLDGLNNPRDDGAGIIAERTPDCKQYILPKNLNQPTYANESYREMMMTSAGFVKHITFTLANGTAPQVDETARKVLLHIRGDGETVFGPYNNEYFIILATTDEGTKIKEVTEFLDSRTFLNFREQVVKAFQGGREGPSAQPGV